MRLFKTSSKVVIVVAFLMFLCSRLIFRHQEASQKIAVVPNSKNGLPQENLCPAFSDLPGAPPKQCRIYHRCAFEELPHVSGMLESAQFLLHSNNSWARLADIEYFLIQGRDTKYQQADPELARRLKQILTTYQSNLTIGIPDLFTGVFPFRRNYQDYWIELPEMRSFLTKSIRKDIQYLEALTTSSYTQSHGTGCQLVPLIYDTLREIWKDRDLVILRGNNGQVYQYDVYDTARSQTVLYAPPSQAWSEYPKLLKDLLMYDRDKLYILAIGPVATVLASDLNSLGRRALDLGHLAKDYDYYRRNLPIENFWQD